MSRDTRGERFVLVGLVGLLVILSISLVIDLLIVFEVYQDGKPVPEEVAGMATTSAVILAVIGVLGTYLSRSQNDQS